MSKIVANDPGRPVDPQIDNPDIVRPAREQPDDRSPLTIIGNIAAVLLVIGSVYLAYCYYSPSGGARNSAQPVIATTSSVRP